MSGLKAPMRHARYYREIEQYMETRTDGFTMRADRIFNAEARRIATAYEQGGASAALAAPDEKEWLEYLNRLWITTAPEAAGITDHWLTGGAKADIPVKEKVAVAARNRIRQLGPDKARGIVQTSQEIIVNTLATAEPASGGRTLLLALINAYSDKAKKRSRKIAYSEVHESTNYGTMEAATSLYRAVDKVWVATPDNRVRDAHIAAQGQRRQLDQFFLVGGDRLNFPGDSSLGASLSNTLNCRCIVTYQARTDRRE
jgi:hypothetical protein